MRRKKPQKTQKNSDFLGYLGQFRASQGAGKPSCKPSRAKSDSLIFLNFYKIKTGIFKYQLPAYQQQRNTLPRQAEVYQQCIFLRRQFLWFT